MRSDRWLWVILCLGAAVRLYGLGERSLSYDECQQYWASQGNVLRSNRTITLDPPAFAALLHLQSLAATSEISLRLLPCLLGILGIPAVYLLARRLSDDAFAARASAFFFALAPYPIRYSQSLRVYSLTLLVCALLPALFLIELSGPSRRRFWILGGLACAGLLTMYGVVWLVAGMLAILALLPSARESSGRLGAAAALVAGGLAAAPLYAYSLPVQMTQGTPASFYDDKFLPLDGLLPALRFLAMGLLDLFGYFSFILPATGLAFGALAITGMFHAWPRREGRMASVLFAFAVAAAAAASAFRLYPFGGTRQMLYSAPLFYAFAGCGIAALKGRFGGWLSRGLLASLVLGCAVFLVRYHTEPGGQEMRPALQYMSRKAESGDRVLVNKDAIPQFRFYYGGSPAAVRWGKETVILDYVEEVNRILASEPSGRWWLVFSHGWSDERRALLARLDPRYVIADRFEAHRAAVFLLEPRPEGVQDRSSLGSTP